MTTIHGLVLVPGLYALCFAGLTYVLMKALQDASASYASEYTEDTARQFEDLFLFIPPNRLLEIARVSAVVLFIVTFLLTGRFDSLPSVLLGVVAASLMACLALFAPKVLLRILKARRLKRFNEQLVDGLTTMSNALRAGFSILQAFESVVKERRNPIAQEFGMLLQQIRVGVRFEDALHDLDRRVGSEDLTLVLLSIETARQTGGNLTEVFDTIAATVRERMRIQGRINSLTAQGKLQGVIIGLTPFLLMLVMTVLDAPMMTKFFVSKPGMGMVAGVFVLEAIGFYFIRKIITIDI